MHTTTNRVRRKITSQHRHPYVISAPNLHYPYIYFTILLPHIRQWCVPFSWRPLRKPYEPQGKPLLSTSLHVLGQPNKALVTHACTRGLTCRFLGCPKTWTTQISAIITYKELVWISGRFWIILEERSTFLNSQLEWNNMTTCLINDGSPGTSDTIRHCHGDPSITQLHYIQFDIVLFWESAGIS